MSRESVMHLAIYDAFPEVNGVIHAHPKYANVFAALAVVPTSGYTEKFGQVRVVPPLPAPFTQLAEAVVAALAPCRGELVPHGLALILAWHGVITVGHDLNDALDILELIEWSAHTMLMANLLAGIAEPQFIATPSS